MKQGQEIGIGWQDEQGDGIFMVIGDAPPLEEIFDVVGRFPTTPML